MATSSNTDINPRRGEVWQVDLNPTLGAEIRKIRPVVVVSSDSLRSLPIRLFVPIYNILLNKQSDAIRNAKNLLELFNPKDPANNNPSTTVHQLVEALNEAASRNQRR